MSKKLRVGMIGCGGIAGSHLKCIQELDCIELVATADMLPERAREYARQYGAKRSYGSNAELLADAEIQAVHICLPHHVHHSVGMQAIAAGKHILMEKPLALTVAAAEQMIAAAEAKQVTLMVGHVMRFRNVNREARRLIQDGAIGAPRSVLRRRIGRVDHEKLAPWHADPKQIGNFCIFGFGTHEVDTILWTLDTHVSRAFATGVVINPVWGNEDDVFALLKLANGAMASYVQSMNVIGGAWDCAYVGTAGSLTVTSDTLMLNGESHPIPPQEGGGMIEQIEEFATACLEGRQPESSAQDCMRTQRALNAMWTSVQSGQAVEV
jgi:UDP-N-acetylglucosamine 3-dehydrogenase